MVGPYYIGLMSGTSLDGVDAVLIDFSSSQSRVLAHCALHMPHPLRQTLLDLNQPAFDELHRAAVASHQLVHLYAEATTATLRDAGLAPAQITAIGAHGQTVRHLPPGALHHGQQVEASNPALPPYTLQLNQPALLAELTGITVVADFRSRDLAAGGQGAPLVPAFHRQVFAHPERSVAVVNIGGIANVTALPSAGQVLGFDTGPGNALLDLWCQRHTGKAYDAAGAWAAQGSIQPVLLERLLSDPYFTRQGIKSTGRDLFNEVWLQRQLDAMPPLPPQDVQATLTQFTAVTIARALKALSWGHVPLSEVLVCGGGAHNTHLMSNLRHLMTGIPVLETTARGWPVMQVEAAAFAWLARQAIEKRPGNEPAVTGAAGPRILGAIYPA